MLVLGNAGFIGYSAPNVGLYINGEINDEAVDKLKASNSITIRDYLSESEALVALEKGTLSALITLNNNSKITVTTREGDIAEQEVVENFVFKMMNENTGEIKNVSNEIAEMNYQGYKGFIVPGIAAMAIMQNGIFSVVFTLLSYKNQGVLKRLKAAPISPSHFIVGHLISRVTIIILQTFVLLLMGVFVLDVSIGQGNIFAWINILFLSFLGGILFLAIGLAISSLAPNEDSAPAIANLVTFPMLFLSGVFFPIDFLPRIIGYISNLLPLTHLAQGIRLSALYGNSSIMTMPQIGITFAWLALSFFICAISFKWE
tara:strand:- start:581 stop:1528 length:948 start_codon:yes stop_codon:yes gene_type:complete